MVVAQVVSLAAGLVEGVAQASGDWDERESTAVQALELRRRAVRLAQLGAPLGIVDAAADMADLASLAAEHAEISLRVDAAGAALLAAAAAAAAARLVEADLVTGATDERVAQARSLAGLAASAADRATSAGD